MGDALSGGGRGALVVADAGAAVGLGHLSRCTALAAALAERGLEVEARALGAASAFALDGVGWEPWRPDRVAGPSPGLLVVDTYDAGAWREVAALPHGRLAAFEDALPDRVETDATIASEEDAEAPGLVLGGPRFACLRRPYWHLGPREIREPPSTVLVTSGGSYLGGLAARVAARLRDRASDIDPPRAGQKSAAPIGVELIWAPGFAGEPPPGVAVVESPASLLEPLLRCDAVVCTGGQTLLEAAAAGAAALVLEGAPNQRRQIAALAARGATIPVREDEVPAALGRLLADTEARRDLSTRAREAVDGRGALRIAAELEALVPES